MKSAAVVYNLIKYRGESIKVNDLVNMKRFLDTFITFYKSSYCSSHFTC